MANLTLKIPNTLLSRVKLALGSKSNEAVREHLLSALEAFHQKDKPLDTDTERKLLEGLKSPKIHVNQAYWDAKVLRYGQRHLKRKRA